MWDLWWTKWRLGRFSPSTSVFPANLHSTNFSIITITYHPVAAAVPKVPSQNKKKSWLFQEKSSWIKCISIKNMEYWALKEKRNNTKKNKNKKERLE
jgi:hypothetical protein